MCLSSEESFLYLKAFGCFFFFYVKMGLVNFVYRQMTPRGRAGLGDRDRDP